MPLDYCDCCAQQLKQQLAEYTSCFALARSPLAVAVVLAVIHGLFGLLRVGARGRATHSSPPPPSFPLSPSVISHLASVDASNMFTYFTYRAASRLRCVSRFGLAVRRTVRLVSRGTSLRICFGSPFSSKVVVRRRVWTLPSCDFVPHN